MEIVITISERDLVRHPDIMDTLKVIGHQLSEKTESNDTKQTVTDCVVNAVMDAKEQVKTETIEDACENAQSTEVIKEPEADEQQSYSVEDVRAAFAKVGKKYGAARAKELLQQFNVTRVTDLEPKNYAEAVFAAEAVM